MCIRPPMHILILVTLTASVVVAYDNGAPNARLPTLGWSSWIALGPGAAHPVFDYCDAAGIMAAADAFVEVGLYDAGYRHFHLDDCANIPSRDISATLGASAPLRLGDPTARCTPRSKLRTGISLRRLGGPAKRQRLPNAGGGPFPRRHQGSGGLRALEEPVVWPVHVLGGASCSGLARGQLWLLRGLPRRALFSSLAADHMCGRSPRQLWALAARCRRICRVGRGLGEAGTMFCTA